MHYCKSDTERHTFLRYVATSVSVCNRPIAKWRHAGRIARLPAHWLAKRIVASSCSLTCVSPTELKPSKKVVHLLSTSASYVCFVHLLRTSGASRNEIEEAVFELKVAELWEVCKELHIKVGNTAKVALAARVICYWRTGLFDSQQSCLCTHVALTKISKFPSYWRGTRYGV